MKRKFRIQPRWIVLMACLIAIAFGSRKPTCAQDANADAKLDATMVLMNTPKESEQIVLTVWDRADPITSTILADSVIEGICVHCNIAMKFKAGQAAAHCSVCPCGASFAECLTGKGTPKTTGREMLDALPQGVGLRIEFIDPHKPDAGVKRLVVDLHSVLLPLEKPVQMTDEQLLALVKPLDVQRVERSNGDCLLLLKLKKDWTLDRANRLAKIFTEHGIILKFSPTSPAKS